MRLEDWRCQRKRDWNSAPLLVWMTGTRKGSRREKVYETQKITLSSDRNTLSVIIHYESGAQPSILVFD
jgi:hypothetical protein